jgi:ribonuclease D
VSQVGRTVSRQPTGMGVVKQVPESDEQEPGEIAVPPPTPLLEPRDGTPDPVDTPGALDRIVSSFQAGVGPVAVDAERASGYRYGQRAYLIQLRRAGAGTALIDPLPFEDLIPLDRALKDAEWVLHAASQDLPCLLELGMRPSRLFDTELAGRLAGFDRVGLGAMVEKVLGFSLEKGHSAADWSTRPLPREWLTYAALDVELLIDLRDELAEELTRQGKLAWAEEEFAALASAGPTAARIDPWRRTSGIHKVRTPRGLARVQALWEARDDLARRRDTAPGRVVSDSAIIAAALADPPDEKSLAGVAGFSGRATKRSITQWASALDRARALTDGQLPPLTVTTDAPPPAHRWADRDPVAAARLVRCRAAVTGLAATLNVPPENLIAPDAVRRIAWAPPDPLDAGSVAAALEATGARSWQIALTSAALAEAVSI